MKRQKAMRHNPIISVASAGPFYWSGPPADDPRPGRTKNGAENHGQTANGTRERPPTSSLSAQAFDVLLAAELGDLRRRQQPGLNEARSYARRHGASQNSEVWWDQLLAEIEHLAGELGRKLVHVALFRVVQPLDEASDRDNAAPCDGCRKPPRISSRRRWVWKWRPGKRFFGQARTIFSGRARPRSGIC